MPLTRRELLGAAAAGAGLAALPFGRRLSDPRAVAQSAPLGVAFDPAPFTLGVASGDPTGTSVVLWTRLAPEPLVEAGAALPERVEVDWVVAEDPRLRRVVRSGTTVAGPELGHSVHVDPGGLEPGRTYWYRFAALGRVSRIGRTRTAPPPGAPRMRFAYVSCANFQQGEFAAYRNLAHEEVDVVLCLGDYFYEYGAGEYGGYREHQDFEVVTRDQYRQRHALYKGDPNLRAAHAAFPWIVTWDDHEVDNDYAADLPENDNEAEGNASAETFLQRRADAYAAYYEHLPMRLPDGGLAGANTRIYRSLSFGDLLDVAVVDTRQYRSDQPCGGSGIGPGALPFAGACAEQEDPSRTMLGAAQKTWLTETLSSSTAAWRVVANQVMFAPLFSASLVGLLGNAGVGTGGVPDLPTGDVPIPVPVGGNASFYFNLDQWDGYLAERRELTQFLAQSQLPDTFVITGDIHSHWVQDVPADPDDEPGGPVVATEFVGTSITSDGFDDTFESSGGPPGSGRAFESIARQAFYADNPQMRFFEGNSHGYAIVEVTREAITNTFRVISDRTDRYATVATLAAFRRARGDLLVTQVEGGLGNPRR